MNQLKEFAASLVAEIKGLIADAVSAWREAHEALRATVAELRASVESGEQSVAEIKARLTDGSLRGADGKDAAPLTGEDVRAQLRELLIGFPEIVGEEVRGWLVEHPPENGRDGADGRDGVDGKSVAIEDVERMVQERVSVKFAEWLVDAERRVIDMTQRAIDKIPEPRDGKDGRDGRDGKDGKPGKDGHDGFGFDDLTFAYDGERGLKLTFVRGEDVKEFPITVPVPRYRGVFKEGTAYELGDMVTWGGNLWHCDVPTQEKPQPTGPKLWSMAAQRGRDGKDAR
jgi:hypothetical protein